MDGGIVLDAINISNKILCPVNLFSYALNINCDFYVFTSISYGSIDSSNISDISINYFFLFY